MKRSLQQIENDIPECDRCPELRSYCANVARQKKRRAFADQNYWAKPVPGFGDRKGPRIWIIGLAPAAHGANRTGRMFTGDRSGDFLYAALHRAGLASQPEAVARNDGLELNNVYISATLRCAPPGNKPTTDQISACATWLDDEWRVLKRDVRIILALGGIAWKSALALGDRFEWNIPKPRPKFGHGESADLGPVTLLGSYHVSQQNTFTGRLTEAMFDDVLKRATAIADQ